MHKFQAILLFFVSLILEGGLVVLWSVPCIISLHFIHLHECLVCGLDNFVQIIFFSLFDLHILFVSEMSLTMPVLSEFFFVCVITLMLHSLLLIVLFLLLVVAFHSLSHKIIFCFGARDERISKVLSKRWDITVHRVGLNRQARFLLRLRQFPPVILVGFKLFLLIHNEWLRLSLTY